jgi:hypothetical protein
MIAIWVQAPWMHDRRGHLVAIRARRQVPHAEVRGMKEPLSVSRE